MFPPDVDDQIKRSTINKQFIVIKSNTYETTPTHTEKDFQVTALVWRKIFPKNDQHTEKKLPEKRHCYREKDAPTRTQKKIC